MSLRALLDQIQEDSDEANERQKGKNTKPKTDQLPPEDDQFGLLNQMDHRNDQMLKEKKSKNMNMNSDNDSDSDGGNFRRKGRHNDSDSTDSSRGRSRKKKSKRKKSKKSKKKRRFDSSGSGSSSRSGSSVEDLGSRSGEISLSSEYDSYLLGFCNHFFFRW